jgi:hypothetical protein
MSTIHYFGIRHHGPGSSRRLLAALNALQPSHVLIEGPSDLTALMPLLAHPDMQLPVALMSFVTDDRAASIYYPFAEYSPEYQAICWAVQQHAELKFIDLPMAQQLASMISSDDTINDDALEHEDIAKSEIWQDPLALLAKLAGYEDSESWWNQILEQTAPDEPTLFANIETTMTALRNHQPDQRERTLQREAYMRLQIAEISKDASGPVAVICGAWHLPGLRQNFSKKADKATLGTMSAKLSAKQFCSTWVPWTSTRLSLASGYGAGVDAPQWYQHLWEHGYNEQSLVHWLTLTAAKLRATGTTVSTAAIIEATRLCQSLAQVRKRPSAGFEEARDAAIACFCFGNTLLWQQIETELLQGDMVGVVPADVPLAPLLDDLQQWQKRTRLKPSALPSELALDLRSDAGLTKSILLRRLQLLNVHWGKPSHAGNSRGTFRERWVLEWQPEFAVQLVEHQVHGSSIELASARLTMLKLNDEKRLATLAELILTALEAQLPTTAAYGISRLAERAAHGSECIELLDALPPLVDINRYGTSRDMTLSHLVDLVEQLAVQAALALPFAVRNLNDEESQRFQQAILTGHRQLELAQCPITVMTTWWQALESICHDDGCDSGARGVTARLLYQADRQSAEQVHTLLQKLLSPSLPLARTKGFFEGFFANASEQLLYDANLRHLTNSWLMALDEQSFIESLPLLRRVFGSLDAMERRRLLDNMLQGDKIDSSSEQVTHCLEHMPLSFARVLELMKGNPTWMQ